MRGMRLRDKADELGGLLSPSTNLSCLRSNEAADQLAARVCGGEPTRDSISVNVISFLLYCTLVVTGKDYSSL